MSCKTYLLSSTILPIKDNTGGIKTSLRWLCLFTLL